MRFGSIFALLFISIPVAGVAADTGVRNQIQGASFADQGQCGAAIGNNLNAYSTRACPGISDSMLTISYPGRANECVFIDNLAQKNFFVPLRTPAEWDAFKLNHPHPVSIVYGCLPLTSTDLCGRAVSLPQARNGTVKTQSYNGKDVAYSCVATAACGAWQPTAPITCDAPPPPPATGCAERDIAWTVNDATCTGHIATTAEGATADVNATGANSGAATYSCTGGDFALQSATCTAPVVTDTPPAPAADPAPASGGWQPCVSAPAAPGDWVPFVPKVITLTDAPQSFFNLVFSGSGTITIDPTASDGFDVTISASTVYLNLNGNGSIHMSLSVDGASTVDFCGGGEEWLDFWSGGPLHVIDGGGGGNGVYYRGTGPLTADWSGGGGDVFSALNGIPVFVNGVQKQ